MSDFNSSTTYNHGDVVTHGDDAYKMIGGPTRKRSGSTSTPGEDPAMWQLLDIINISIADFRVVETQLSSYEARVAEHRAKTLKALEDAGLDPADVGAVLKAG